MPPPHAKRDVYGRPRPTLSVARDAPPPKEIPWNHAQSQYLHAKLDEVLAALLRSGIYGEVSLTIVIKDGVVQADGEVLVRQLWRYNPEEG